MTRSIVNWGELPGSFDTTNSYLGLYPPAEGNNRFGIPSLEPITTATVANFDKPDYLIAYRSTASESKRLSNDPEFAARAALHFYLDDYRFEAVWSCPRKSLTGLHKFGFVLTPDFSLYRDWPLAAQIWNIYRSRWLGALWQAQGLKGVIPTVSWSYPASYEFCFLGIEPGGWVSLSNVGIAKDKEAGLIFDAGFEVMLERLRPSLILWYGDKVAEKYHILTETVCGGKIVVYPTHWQTFRDLKKVAS